MAAVHRNACIIAAQQCICFSDCHIATSICGICTVLSCGSHEENPPATSTVRVRTNTQQPRQCTKNKT